MQRISLKNRRVVALTNRRIMIRRTTSFFCSAMGDSFGELALIQKNNIRNASIIADERTDLLVVDHDVYYRSLHASQAEEFEARVQFVNDHPLFRCWPVQHRRQMAMSIQRRRALFDDVIVRQGDGVDAMFFILR